MIKRSFLFLGMFRLLLFGVLLALVFGVSSCNRQKSYKVKTILVPVDSLSQIVNVSDSLVVPYVYTQVSGIDKLPVHQIKSTFISVALPAVLVATHTVEERKRKLIALHEKKKWTAADSTFYGGLKARYKAVDLEDLIAKMITLPNSIVLAQAAVESGWGKSRFFLEGNNVFGIWSYNKSEPRIRAGRARESRVVYVRAYEDIVQSVIDYLETLGSAKVYRNLRKTRQETDDPFELLPHLRYYSEKRAVYTNQLKTMIVKNNLTQYDHYKIHPRYIVEEKD